MKGRKYLAARLMQRRERCLGSPPKGRGAMWVNCSTFRHLKVTSGSVFCLFLRNTIDTSKNALVPKLTLSPLAKWLKWMVNSFFYPSPGRLASDLADFKYSILNVNTCSLASFSDPKLFLFTSQWSLNAFSFKGNRTIMLFQKQVSFETQFVSKNQMWNNILFPLSHTEHTLESLLCELPIKHDLFGSTDSPFPITSLPWCQQAPRTHSRLCLTTAESQNGTWFKILAHIHKWIGN